MMVRRACACVICAHGKRRKGPRSYSHVSPGCWISAVSDAGPRLQYHYLQPLYKMCEYVT